jgi:hypothetical protein
MGPEFFSLRQTNSVASYRILNLKILSPELKEEKIIIIFLFLSSFRENVFVGGPPKKIEEEEDYFQLTFP